MNRTILQTAMGTSSQVNIHLVSGEFLSGTCEKTNDPNTIKIKTNNSEQIIPYWTIKRVKMIR
ncbi:hypothetical protein DCC85_17260 [Paenibacillus sp. CAA11]|uniref:hypothetical protein n=1 Tax=Paenibacillus sp. CAA11 TaxID=1532905 RepID=UPI000D33C1B0|nr:hypothetical protein [Paenibacillus sp. CAA11]AWB45763.1 hypothetical protein DCC85_17260 [Paenibacillus sp. CAA11]